MSSIACPFCPHTARSDAMNKHVAAIHEKNMMDELCADVARAAMNTKTPLLWKRAGSGLAYAHCLACKKSSINDPVGFKRKHSVAECRAKWSVFADEFRSCCAAEEAAKAAAGAVIEHVGGEDKDAIYHAILDKQVRPDEHETGATVEQRLKALIKWNERIEKENFGLWNGEERDRVQIYDLNTVITHLRQKITSWEKHFITEMRRSGDEIARLKIEGGVDVLEERIRTQALEIERLHSEERRLVNRFTDLTNTEKENGELKKKVEELTATVLKLKIKALKRSHTEEADE